MATEDTHTDDSILNDIKISKIIPPILIGLLVVGYLMYQQLDLDELRSVAWNGHMLFWILASILCYVIRHWAYSWRLRILTDEEFSWPKSVELIVLWEFASAVSPTTIGGAGVAFFLLAQEKLSTAKTVSVVLYSMVIDTLFFVLTVPVLYLLFGSNMIRPGADTGVYDFAFWSIIGFMAVYGVVFFYGLFINPRAIKRLLFLIAKIPFLKRFQKDLRKTAMDVVVTSTELRSKPFGFHLRAFTATSIAWIIRFIAINCIIIALVPDVAMDMYNQALMYARGESMHIIMSFTPTPGGAGFAEALFGGFYSEYISTGLSTLAALIWRVITYYSYLIAGAIIIPVWIGEVLVRRQKEKVNRGF